MGEPLETARFLLGMKHEPNPRALMTSLAELVDEVTRLRGDAVGLRGALAAEKRKRIERVKRFGVVRRQFAIANRKTQPEPFPYWLLAEYDGAYPERCALCGVEYSAEDDANGIEAVHAENCPQSETVMREGPGAVVRALIETATAALRERDAARALAADRDERAAVREAKDILVSTYAEALGCEPSATAVLDAIYAALNEARRWADRLKELERRLDEVRRIVGGA